MTNSDNKKSAGKQSFRMGARLALLVLLLVALWLVPRFYLAQEFLVVLLIVAILMAVLLLLAVAITLFQEGFRRTVLWTKAGASRLSALDRPHGNP